MADGPEFAHIPFPAGGGATGALVRALDWSLTPLGPIDGWPPSLRSVVSLVLGSPLAMLVLWGPDLVQVYNDACAVICGPKHPRALGQPTRDCWPELWAFNAPIYEAVLRGETRSFTDQPVGIERHGHSEDAWFDLNFSPLRDDGGRVAGVLVTVVETTRRVQADRRIASERERLARMFEQAPCFIVMLRGPEHVFEVANAAYRQFIGRGVVVGMEAREALPDVVEQGFIDLLDHVVATREPNTGRGVPISFQVVPGGPVEQRFMDYIVQPLIDAGGAVDGLFIQGSDVTDRVRIDTDLRASERRYRQIVEGAEDFAIVAIDDKGTISDWNSGAEHILGWTREQAVGQPFRLIFTPEDVAEGVPESEITRAQSDGRAVDERWHLKRDGSRFWGSGLTMRLDDGGFLKMFRDRTAEHNAEAALQASEERFRLMADVAPHMMWITDGDGQNAYFNKRWEEYTGGPWAPTAGKVAAGSLHPDDAAPTMAAFLAARAPGGVFEVEHRIRSKTGEYRWFLVRGEALRDPDTQDVIRWYGASVDIHDRREAEAALRHSEGQMRALNADLEAKVAARTAERTKTWEVSPDLLSVTGLGDGCFEQVNPAWEAVLGWQAAEMEGRPFADFIHPDDLARSMEAFGRLRHGEPVLNFENRYRCKDGSWRWLSWVAVPEGSRLYSSTRDITAAREQAEALAEAEEALRQSQKMEAVGHLTGGLAHDFNNLLAGISGSLELIGRRIAQGRVAEVDRYLAGARESAARAAALTHRLLAFSRRQTLAPKPTDAGLLVAGIEDLIRRTVGPEIEIDCVLGKDVWAVEVDPNQLENALLNLAINARDAMPDGGRITIETANRALDGIGATVQGLSPGQYVALRVSDTGTGMAPEVIARAFDPFFTTKPIGLGTGLGLSMVYGFARQSGGQARIHSQVGQGTTISLYLPRYLGAAKPVETAAAAAPDEAVNAAHGETVLVIDDEPLVRMLVVDALTELGYVAIEAPDGAEGLDVLRSKARVDLLVTDVGLPGGLNGRQVADAARELRPGLPVLFITGYADTAVLSHGHLDRRMYIITKPFGVDDVARRIRAILAGT